MRSLLRLETEAARAHAALKDLEDHLIDAGWPSVLEDVNGMVERLGTFRALLADAIDEEAERAR